MLVSPAILGRRSDVVWYRQNQRGPEEGNAFACGGLLWGWGDYAADGIGRDGELGKSSGGGWKIAIKPTNSKLPSKN
jgi:hypothetical protein